MNLERIEALLERIASALERIASQGEPTSGIAERNGHSTNGAERPAPDEALAKPPSIPAPPLEAYLLSRSIQIKSRPPSDPADEVIDSLSLYLGEHYDALASLLRKIKRAMQTGARITECLKGRTQQEVGAVCQFCTRLQEVAFLEQYQYFKSPDFRICAKTTTLPRAQRFFGGQWLERYILRKVRTIHGQIASEVGGGIGFEYLINPQIILPNGDDFELDVLAAIGASIYWIEAKTGDYQQHVSKYSRFARLLGLDYDHSLMVLTDIPENRCDALSSLFTMTVCTLANFYDRMLEIVRRDAEHWTTSLDGASPVSPS